MEMNDCSREVKFRNVALEDGGIRDFQIVHCKPKRVQRETGFDSVFLQGSIYHQTMMRQLFFSAGMPVYL